MSPIFSIPFFFLFFRFDLAQFEKLWNFVCFFFVLYCIFLLFSLLTTHIFKLWCISSSSSVYIIIAFKKNSNQTVLLKHIFKILDHFRMIKLKTELNINENTTQLVSNVWPDDGIINYCSIKNQNYPSTVIKILKNIIYVQ